MVDNQFIKAVEELENSNLVASQKEIATALGYKEQAFTEIMKGRSKVKTSTIQLFCNMYDISLDWLFYGKGEMFKKEDNMSSNIISKGVNGNTINGNDIHIQNIEHNTLVEEVIFLRDQIKEKDSIISRLMAKLNL
jgi:transcriptional regulator with XRE-family HTH domain